jgi:hypothetical protein
MTLGVNDPQLGLRDDLRWFCEPTLSENSIFSVLERDNPRRIFETVLEVAQQAGLVGAKRILDSTPLYDAVATMDTITLIRSAIRSLLRMADTDLESELRGVLSSGDTYESSSKPQIDWDDAEAREGLIDSRARDAMACLPRSPTT